VSAARGRGEAGVILEMVESTDGMRRASGGVGRGRRWFSCPA
jgi:hypothetical protein